MNGILSMLGSAGDFILVVLGFSLIIVIHELGHFVAARWAGIRVLAFAVGFGPALLSFRKGLGLRRGSSEVEYRKLVGGSRAGGGAISSTEYRLNLLPFGGYVKMLGQDDLDPAARSAEPDSYQNCKPWRRMIVISAGVVANVITACILFIVVFMAGLKTEPAKVGAVEPGSPAATAVATNGAALGVTNPGLQSGDEIIAINGEQPLSFNDLVLASAMARRGAALRFEVKRAGVPGVLDFPVVPVQDRTTRMLYIGVLPAASNVILSSGRQDDRDRFRQMMSERGLPGLEAGMKLLSIDGREARSAYDLSLAVERSQGKPVTARFRSTDGRDVDIVVPSRPRMFRERFMIDSKEAREARHLLGLMPVLSVEDVPPGEGGAAAGLKPGDVFARIGSVEWPSVPSGIAEIRAHRGRTVPVVVARRDPTSPEGRDARWVQVPLGDVRVSPKGTIGFGLGDSSAAGSWVGTAFAKAGQNWSAPNLAAGSRIVAVNGETIASLLDLRERLRRASASGATDLVLTVESPLQTTDGSRITDEVTWKLTDADARALAAAPWEPALDAGLFEAEKVLLKASGPLGAMHMGVRETKRVMLTTYVTLARLFQGSIKVEHLKGPVGIAHVGTILAGRGYIWLLFFMALISVNLAVINFLPIPIADGGHFVFLVYEQVTGKPVSAAVQNVAAIAGLILLATVFVIVTFNDITNLFRG